VIPGDSLLKMRALRFEIGFGWRMIWGPAVGCLDKRRLIFFFAVGFWELLLCYDGYDVHDTF